MDIALTAGQHSLVYNAFSLVFATMAGAGLFFWGVRNDVAPKYRVGVVVSAVVVFIAAYHYLRIWQSWGGAFVLDGGLYVPSDTPFNDAYRYADWLITVPLLLVELVAVLGLVRAVSGPMLRNLVIASVLMIVLGYPGEISADAGTRWIFWALAMIPFVYILWVLFGQLTAAIASESDRVKMLLARARTVLIASWWVYPVAFVLPMIGLSGATAYVGVQLGYSVADLTAKALYGVVIYQIAVAKTEAEGSA